MPRLSLGLGVQAVSKVKAGAAPSGISVASTASVVITNGGDLNGTAIKKTVGQMCWGVSNGNNSTVTTGVIYSYNLGVNIGAGLIQPQAADSNQFFTQSNNWQILYTSYDSEYNETITLASATNPSTDPATIPTTGWSPSVTITAA